MIKITLEINIQNHKELLHRRGGILGSIYSKIAKAEDAIEKVESVVRKDMLARIGGETEKALAAEGVKADVVAYIEKRSDITATTGDKLEHEEN